MTINQLITQIKAYIYQNSINDITGQELQNILINVVNNLYTVLGNMGKGFLGHISINDVDPTPKIPGYYMYVDSGTTTRGEVYKGDVLIVEYTNAIHTYYFVSLKMLYQEIIDDILADTYVKKSEVKQAIGNDEALPMSQNAVTNNLCEYNVSRFNVNRMTGDDNFNTNIFSFAQAVDVVPTQLRVPGMKIIFLMKMKITNTDKSISSVIKEMSYLFQSSSADDWSSAASWQCLSPVILTESQYEGLQEKLDNTLYYVIEEE